VVTESASGVRDCFFDVPQVRTRSLGANLGAARAIEMLMHLVVPSACDFSALPGSFIRDACQVSTIACQQ
jgi:hypothetical protein